MADIVNLSLLFFASFFAATIFPAQSEIILATLNYSKNYDSFLLLAIASLGNILGAIVNWFLGYYLFKFKDKKWFLLKDLQIDKYSKIYKKWGKWSLLFAWLPFVGDPLTIIAGFFKTNIWIFIFLVGIGKVSRYVFIIWLS